MSETVKDPAKALVEVLAKIAPRMKFSRISAGEWEKLCGSTRPEEIVLNPMAITPYETIQHITDDADLKGSPELHKEFLQAIVDYMMMHKGSRWHEAQFSIEDEFDPDSGSDIIKLGVKWPEHGARSFEIDYEKRHQPADRQRHARIATFTDGNGPKK